MLLGRQSLFLPRLMFFFPFLKSSYIFLFSFTYYNEIRFLTMIYTMSLPLWARGNTKSAQCFITYMYIHVELLPSAASPTSTKLSVRL